MPVPPVMLGGWKACGLSFLMGMMLTLGFAPFHFVPAALAAFIVFMLLLRGRQGKSAFAIGWWFAFGHFTTGLYWIAIALNIDNGAFGWMIPFAVGLLPAYIALYYGAASYCVTRWFRHPLALAPAFAVFWCVAEWLRAHAIYGFPWNLTGYVWSFSTLTLQPAAIFGVYGMSLLFVWAAASCAVFFARDIAPRNRIIAIAAPLILLCGLWGWGALRLEQPQEVQQEAPQKPVVVRLVQANIEQTLKWQRDHLVNGFLMHLALSEAVNENGVKPDYIIWPETAMPFDMKPGPGWFEALAKVAPETGSLITGAVRVEQSPEGYAAFNSVYAVKPTQHIVSVYDKNVLVPFGEFVPFRFVLQWFGVEKITQGIGDFSRGQGAAIMNVEGQAPHVQPLICYEAIFPEFRVDEGQEKPDWLLNITNDAWFGRSIGPYQHLQMARFRSVERGIPMVRVANTGVSAVFDAFGREIASMPLGYKGYMDVNLPVKMQHSTLYTRLGELMALITGFFLLVSAIIINRKCVSNSSD